MSSHESRHRVDDLVIETFALPEVELLRERVRDLEADNQQLRELLQRAIDALGEKDLDLGRARLMNFLLLAGDV
jgi:hypothetical protein